MPEFELMWGLKSFFVGVLQISSLFFVAYQAFRMRQIKWLRILYAPYPHLSLGMLISMLVFFVMLLFLSNSVIWNVYSFSVHFFAFILGVQTVILLLEIFQYKTPAFLAIYRLDNERYEAFLGAVVACLFLNIPIQFSSENTSLSSLRMLLLPLIIGIVGVFSGIALAILAEYYPKKVTTLRLFWSVLDGFLLAVSSFFLCFYFIPEKWFFGGVMVTSSELFWVLQVGIAAGVVAGNFVELYKLLSKIYIRFLLYKPSKSIKFNLFLRFCLNVLLATLPLLTVIAGLVIAFQRMGLYGLAMSVLCMFANVGFGVVVEGNLLKVERLPHLEEYEKQKIQDLSPRFASIIKNFFKKIIPKKGS
ncbi:MAG: hypothetical protein OHK0038_20760 [Flammeovirgaceae bacterium]